MKLRLRKLIHHLLGLAGPSAYKRRVRRWANSCRNCWRYCRSRSASSLELGAAYIELRGNPASPGIYIVRLVIYARSYGEVFKRECSERFGGILHGHGSRSNFVQAI